MQKRIDSLQLDTTANGISLLQVRCHSLLSYLIHLVFLVLRKINGKTINHPVVEQLCELRVILEKTKPLELKLSYQISKLLQFASQTITPANFTAVDQDALLFKPNPSNFVIEETDETESNVYKPPRLVPVPYSDKRISQKTKDSALSSRLMRDISSEFSMAPETINSSGHEARTSKDDDAWNDRIAFEEENFVRMNFTRKDKSLIKRLEKTGLTNELRDLNMDFGEIEGLHRIVEQEGAELKKKRRKERSEGAEDAEEVIARASRGRKSQGKDGYAKDKLKLKKKK